ncbi:uncharacterized protein LOC110916243 isoform X2 [Helianthus annuus]|uniref:uncharacterized protein LOC110916243 isoform X2 n=1 Tax=Helianthus annuus TaxID=4232 RepID=UPI00165322C2|nr:uncharacterized protein LOC110916243 isoform X2 [Helianthus annuus]
MSAYGHHMEWKYSTCSLSTDDEFDPSTISSTMRLSHFNFQRYYISLLSVVAVVWWLVVTHSILIFEGEVDEGVSTFAFGHEVMFFGIQPLKNWWTVGHLYQNHSLECRRLIQVIGGQNEGC